MCYGRICSVAKKKIVLIIGRFVLSVSKEKKKIVKFFFLPPSHQLVHMRVAHTNETGNDDNDDDDDSH